MARTTVPAAVVKKDHQLTEKATRASYDLDRHRWEQCSDPAGPRHTQRDYAEAVGVTHVAIGKSVRAWALALAVANESLVTTVTKDDEPVEHGRTQSETVEAVAAAKKEADAAGTTLADPTSGEHQQAKAAASAGTRMAMVCAALADEFGVAASTVQQNHLWKTRRNDALGGVERLVADHGMTEAEACEAAAAQVREEWDRHQAAAAADAAEEEGIDQVDLMRRTGAVVRDYQEVGYDNLNPTAQKTVDWAIATLTALREGGQMVEDLEDWLREEAAR